VEGRVLIKGMAAAGAWGGCVDTLDTWGTLCVGCGGVGVASTMGAAVCSRLGERVLVEIICWLLGDDGF
jgi:hypothetical protein